MKTAVMTTLALLLHSSAALSAQYLLLAGHMIDVKEGKVLDEVTITVVGNRITAVEPGYTTPGEGQRVVDLRNSTVMPGLMDMHTHLTTEVSPGLFTEKFLMESADYAYRAGLYAERTLLAGFTTVRDMGDQDRNLGAAMRRAIDLHYIHGPRIYTAGKGLGTTGGLADPTNGLRHEFMGSPGPVEGVVDGPLAARQAVRQRYKDGANLIKINLTGGAITPSQTSLGPQWQQDELNAVVQTAADYNLTVAAHAYSAEGIRRAIVAGVNSIEHGDFMDEELAGMMKEQHIAFVPTMTASKWSARMAKEQKEVAADVREEMARMGDQIDKTFAMAYKKGVWIVFGSDSGVFPHGMNADEFGYMVAAGMSPLEAIQSSTIEAAKLLRIDQSLGSIEPGKLADLVAVHGDPLADISLMKTISFIMKDGAIYKEDNRVVMPIGDHRASEPVARDPSDKP
jgi:imidazolonepropionase-like amidohydrolase